KNDNQSATSPQPSPKSNQLTDAEKSQIRQYLVKHGISKISLKNGKLIIEYKNNNKEVIENEDQELTKYHQLIQSLPNQSLSLSELQSDNPNNSSTPSKSNTAIFISLAVGAFILGGVVTRKENEQLQKTTIPSLLTTTRDYVVLVNAKYITFTGNNKLDNEYYYNHSGYPGGLRKRSTRLMLEKYPQELVMRIIKVPNKIFLLELQNRLRENKIKEKELAKILSELTFTQSQELAERLTNDTEINPRRGEVYLVEIVDAQGYEQKGNDDDERLAVVVSNNQQNEKKNVIVIVPLSSKVKKIYPFQVATFFQGKPGRAKCEQVRAITIGRFEKKLGFNKKESSGDSSKIFKVE
ncbi:12042_t:CDS:2, partial [Ambispora leptoticha]